ncbi:peptide ligase PGM1-related protein [Marinactinospora thermotolerans]|uniref:D-alanine-D-alanine ligase and related ATP-grasp enzymes n=1 Tax=Marinactinospora thermotolerans DSM 45154 TaxID=1122192 RepID=A0A1T4PH18_9ACTN|nr:peptide ligase PGM1-related protein [Marinactinospora thermotolerans]SJZ90812.1 D-alanine-D-alanine ligase and related ATP-grasp enzymes [Marinactinospora thermotolerans DSM 45154]
MTTLLIANFPEEIVGDLTRVSPERLRAFGQGAHRLLWYARTGDVLVLPSRPDPVYLDYVTTVTDTDPETLRVLVPPPGSLGPDVLSADRLYAPSFRAELASVLADRPARRVVCFYTDLAVTDLASALGFEAAVPGHAFSSHEGDALANNKAVFRAVAAAAGVPVAPGVSTDRRERAETAIRTLLDSGHPVMVKQQVAAGGLGNEILSRDGRVRAAGALEVVTLPDDESLRDYLDRRWEWLTGHRGHRVVIERYLTDAVTVYAEFEVDDNGCELRGTGEILMEPVAAGEVIPPVSITRDEEARLVEQARRLCDAFRAMGYRGNLCADAIRTPAGELFFSEVNGRVTASTQIHVNVIGRVVGEYHRRRRIFLERAAHWEVTSLPAALAALAEEGIAYDPSSRTGVLITADYAASRGRVTYCVVAKDLETARAYEKRVSALSP